ncbi:phosphopantetheine adenylyltransferase [Ahniella affigens]|uniref:Phosphopantetheine adenylyltransferase n=1 Tax=Ahniella affigens TaxID=2021234 RepID=A0A2P1PM22_9GAMM|nr:phosphopantetheine adenylyltransferase [Ahniella affigens]
MLAALIHLLPVAGVLGAERLQTLYRPGDLGPTEVLLLQHRALLFGVFAMGLLVAVFQPNWRIPTAGMTLLSVLGFLVLAGLNRDAVNPALLRVVIADLIALPALVVVIWMSKR